MKVATFLYKISLCFSQGMVETWWEIGGKYEGNYGDMMERWWEIEGKLWGHDGNLVEHLNANWRWTVSLQNPAPW